MQYGSDAVRREERHKPERTCVGCRVSGPTHMLERFVLLDGQLVHDMRRKAPGRGAWVYPRRACIEGAVRGGFARAFKQRVDAPSPSELLEQLAVSIRQRLRETVSTSMRARQLAVGAEAVKEAMGSGSARLILMAKDAGDATRKKFVTNARRKDLEVLDDLDGNTLGALTGRDFVAVLAVNEDSRAQQIAVDLEHLRAFSAPQGG
ncbi:MAG: DUF448 domain-containing protein [Myxococcota bacterium]